MSITEAFQAYCQQSNATSSSTSAHQDGHNDYVTDNDHYPFGEHRDKHVDYNGSL